MARAFLRPSTSETVKAVYRELLIDVLSHWWTSSAKSRHLVAASGQQTFRFAYDWPSFSESRGNARKRRHWSGDGQDLHGLAVASYSLQSAGGIFAPTWIESTTLTFCRSLSFGRDQLPQRDRFTQNDSIFPISIWSEGVVKHEAAVFQSLVIGSAMSSDVRSLACMLSIAGSSLYR